MTPARSPLVPAQSRAREAVGTWRRGPPRLARAQPHPPQRPPLAAARPRAPSPRKPEKGRSRARRPGTAKKARGRAGWGGGGRRTETKPESRRTARTGPPSRLPRDGIGAWPRGEESLIQGGATTHQRKRRAERETRGASCGSGLEPQTHAPGVDEESARGGGSGNGLAGPGDPPWKHPRAPQRPRRVSTQRAPAAITLAAHAAGPYL